MPELTIELTDEQIQQIKKHFIMKYNDDGDPGDPPGFSLRIDSIYGCSEIIAIINYKELNVGDVITNLETIL
jgi:hypothetical protein